MADHPLPNPALEETCAALQPLGWTWDPLSNTCISPPGIPGVPTTLPGTPPAGTGGTELPTGHVIVTQEEIAALERERDSLRTQRNLAFGGIVAGLVVGAIGGWALAR